MPPTATAPYPAPGRKTRATSVATSMAAARGNAINLRVSGVISATLGVSTNANQQSISIQAPGTELQSVAISLSRGAK